MAAKLRKPVSDCLVCRPALRFFNGPVSVRSSSRQKPLPSAVAALRSAAAGAGGTPDHEFEAARRRSFRLQQAIRKQCCLRMAIIFCPMPYSCRRRSTTE